MIDTEWSESATSLYIIFRLFSLLGFKAVKQIVMSVHGDNIS